MVNNNEIKHNNELKQWLRDNSVGVQSFQAANLISRLEHSLITARSELIRLRDVVCPEDVDSIDAILRETSD